MGTQGTALGRVREAGFALDESIELLAVDYTGKLDDDGVEALNNCFRRNALDDVSGAREFLDAAVELREALPGPLDTDPVIALECNTKAFREACAAAWPEEKWGLPTEDNATS